MSRPGDHERDRIDEQRGPHAEEGNRGSPDSSAGHLGGQVRGLDHRGAQGVVLAAQYARGDRGAGRLERRGEHRGREQQQDQGRHRHTGHGHRHDQDGADRIAGHHHRPARTAVRQVGEEKAADHPGQVPGRVGQGGQQRRPGPVVDQHRQGDQGQAVTCRGQDDRQPHGAELTYREYIAERGARRVGGLHNRGQPLIARRTRTAGHLRSSSIAPAVRFRRATSARPTGGRLLFIRADSQAPFTVRWSLSATQCDALVTKMASRDCANTTTFSYFDLLP